MKILSSNELPIDYQIKKEELLIRAKENQEIYLENVTCSRIKIEVFENSQVIIREIKDEDVKPSQYDIILKENSQLSYNRFHKLNNYHEDINIHLSGEKSKIIYNASFLITDPHNCCLNIYHDYPLTTSIINNHGVISKEGYLDLTVNAYVPKGKIKSYLKQENKVIFLDDNKSVIKPNLLIEEDDVEAFHGASLGKFNDEEIFYLQTRGFDKDSATKLLVRGFLYSNLDFKENMFCRINKNISEE